METVVCLNCYDFFLLSSRHKSQTYCMKPECRRAKKAAWKRTKMKTDPQFSREQHLSNKKWVNNNPGYWTDYRKRKPEKAERNCILQRIRNQRRRANKLADPPLIAKVDASKPNKFGLIGQFWLVPVIAKVDALKVNIVEITAAYQ
jgi:hypothetical protein